MLCSRFIIVGESKIMDANIELYLLGTVQIKRNGQPLTKFESRKALALFCYLVEQRQPVSRTQLTHLFWGAKDEQRGRSNLSRVIHNNALLLPECFEVTRNTVAFKRSATTFIDIDFFLESTQCHQPQVLTAAVECYRGPFMADVTLKDSAEFDTWLTTEQELWRQRVAGVLHTLIAIYRNNGDYEQGLKFSERLLALDDWREEAHREMMLMLALSGQRAAALAQYEKCCDILIEELGVNPSAETTALYYRISNGEIRNQGNLSYLINATLAKTAATASLLSAPASMVTVTQMNGGWSNHAAISQNFLQAPAERKGSEFDQILERLANPSCRMLTLVGPNNVVQKRLLFDIVSSLLKAFQHGVCYVSARQNGEHGLLGDIAASLNLAQGEPTWDEKESAALWLFKQLREKDLLLVISDVETYRHDTLGLLEEILKRAPQIKLLVNAKAPLQLSSEWIFDI